MIVLVALLAVMALVRVLSAVRLLFAAVIYLLIGLMLLYFSLGGSSSAEFTAIVHAVSWVVNSV